jgi:hypothetical protein
MEILQSLSKSISEERLAPYRQGIENSQIVSYARYFWNTALGESLYPCLQALEIALRNSLHEAISTDKGTEDWFDVVLDSQDISAFDEIKVRLNNHKIQPVAGQIVANSDFGFWVRLFNSRYEDILWPKLLKSAFPFMPNSIRTRKSISKRLNRIRAMRNRVFHYEPIWNRTNLGQRHEEILETIGWINPDMLEVVKLFDNSPEVYQSGVSLYEEKLSECLAAKEL